MQYITSGNLADNPKVHLFLVDYAHRRRIKVWGEARVIDDDPALLAKLMPQGYKARGERVIVMSVHAWDVNCPQHIPQRFEAVRTSPPPLQERDERIKRSQREAQVAGLKRLSAASGA